MKYENMEGKKKTNGRKGKEQGEKERWDEKKVKEILETSKNERTDENKEKRKKKEQDNRKKEERKKKLSKRKNESLSFILSLYQE